MEGDIVIMLGTDIEKENNNNESILVVDDEQDTLLLLQLILGKAGFKVYPFDKPLNALSSFKGGLYDLAILDIKMPQMDGFQLYEKIKKIDRTVKVCFITASSEEMYQYDEFRERNEAIVQLSRQAQHQYCEYNKAIFLKKPFSNGDLVKEVNGIINVN